MARELFVDTSGWYALLDRRDPAHRVARRVVAAAVKLRRVLVTTDDHFSEAGFVVLIA
jgi:predicted nucleic acid-binding protein